MDMNYVTEKYCLLSKDTKRKIKKKELVINVSPLNNINTNIIS